MTSRVPSQDELGTIAARLRHLRMLIEPELHARELDRLAHRKQGHATRIETFPDAGITVETAESYARVFGCSLDWLIRGTGRPPTARAVNESVAAARAALVANN